MPLKTIAHKGLQIVEKPKIAKCVHFVAMFIFYKYLPLLK